MLRHYQFLVEIVVFYLLISLANWFFFPHLLGFLDVDPHPFWLGVLLFGFRYGVAAGLASGILSAILYMTAAWAGGETYRFEEFAFYILPSFFMIFGLIIGIVTARERERASELKKAADEKEKETAGAREEIDTLQIINRGLEKKIVTRMTTLVTLYEGARRLEAVTLEDLYPAILDFSAKTLGADEAAIYKKETEGWRLAETYGWPEYVRRPTRIKHDEGLTGMAGAKGKIVTIRDFVKEAPPEFLGDALMAGPLRQGEKGEVIGVLAVQKIPFTEFTSAAVNLFAFLLNWASRAIAKAQYVQALREQEVIDPEYHIYSRKYFLSRLGHEFSRSRTYYLPMTVGLVSVPQLELLAKGQKKNLLLMLATLLRESSRQMDVVAAFGEPQIPFAVLWMTVNERQAAELEQKIHVNFAKMDLAKLPGKISLKIGKSSFTPKIKEEDPEILIRMARENLR